MGQAVRAFLLSWTPIHTLETKPHHFQFPHGSINRPSRTFEEKISRGAIFIHQLDVVDARVSIENSLLECARSIAPVDGDHAPFLRPCCEMHRRPIIHKLSPASAPRSSDTVISESLRVKCTECGDKLCGSEGWSGGCHVNIPDAYLLT